MRQKTIIFFFRKKKKKLPNSKKFKIEKLSSLVVIENLQQLKIHLLHHYSHKFSNFIHISGKYNGKMCENIFFPIEFLFTFCNFNVLYSCLFVDHERWLETQPKSQETERKIVKLKEFVRTVKVGHLFN